LQGSQIPLPKGESFLSAGQGTRSAHRPPDGRWPDGSGRCVYTDADGYDIPIDDGQDVFVDGKLVSCRGGTIVVTTAPKRGVGNLRPQLLDPNLSVLVETPQQPTLVTRGDAPVSKAP
jgi:hypothetical protein